MDDSKISAESILEGVPTECGNCRRIWIKARENGSRGLIGLWLDRVMKTHFFKLKENGPVCRRGV